MYQKVLPASSRAYVSESGQPSAEEECDLPAAEDGEHHSLEEETQETAVEEAPMSADQVFNVPQSPSRSQKATVEDAEDDEDNAQHIHPLDAAAQKAVSNAEEAATILDNLEERAHQAYETYQTAFHLVKTADERSLAALHVAKSTKVAYERNPYSIYHNEIGRAHV